MVARHISRGQVIFAVVMIVIVAALVIWKIGDSAGGRPAETAQQVLARCENLSEAYVQNIAQGITTPGVSLHAAQAVRSKDYDEVWFIAADVEGSGLSGSSHIGIWSSNSIVAPEASGSANDLYAVNDVARQYTEWGLDVKLPVSKTADGVNQVTTCTMKQLTTGA